MSTVIGVGQLTTWGEFKLSKLKLSVPILGGAGNSRISNLPSARNSLTRFRPLTTSVAGSNQ